MSLKSIIREAMGREGKTYKDIANALSITERSVCYKVNGKRQFSFSEIVTLCDYLNIDPVLFFKANIPNMGNSKEVVA